MFARQRFGCYSDILQGSLLFLMFIAVQLAIYDLLPIPAAIISLVPQAPVYATLAPITTGDLVTLTVITAYGAIWGVRLIDSAITRLREISSNESFDNMPVANV